MIFSGRRGARFLAVVVTVALVGSAPGAMADSDAGGISSDGRTSWDVTWPEIGTGMIDVVLLRPLVLAGTGVGFVGFLLILPFNAPAKSIGASWDTFVAAPAKFTFARPIGEF